MINYNLLSKIKNVLLFAFPIILGNLGQILIGAGDVFVAGRHGPNTIAAISIANAILWTIFTVGNGLILSISPVLSKKRGEKLVIDHYFKISVTYAILLSIILGTIAFASAEFVPFMGFSKTLVPYIQDYIYICSFSLPGAYIYMALKEFLQAQEHICFANFISIAAIFLNLFLGWSFVFGNRFIPSLGVNGLAVAALLVRSLMGLTLLLYCHKYFKTSFCKDITFLKEIFRIGYPIALSMMLEFAAFNIITIIAGRVGVIQVAAHNIVLTLSSITFMIPLAISNAIGVKIGYSYGEKNYKNIKEYFMSGILLSIGIMLVFAACFFAIPKEFIRFFSTNAQVISTGAGLLFIVAFFQIFDGAQITISGALRGLGYTKPIMATMLTGYWFVGIPFGVYLAFYRDWGIKGLWTGLAVALFSCAIIFSLFLRKRLKVVKVELEEKVQTLESSPVTALHS